MAAEMMASYLPPNRAWVVTFGDQILNLEDKSGLMGRFFANLTELDYCLSLCGLERVRGHLIRPIKQEVN